ncbi:MAG: stealth conserved region 3 domain-containing protein [Hyphomicrobiales bacterium]
MTLGGVDRGPDEGGVDIVYMWVDGSLPGYIEVLSRYAQTRFDTDPARTRDNLDLLKYSMRSIARFVPWIRKIFVLTCRPQVPAWLDTGNERVQVVHHDAVMDPADLPTFNSLSIVSHVHRIPGLSSTFIYMDDDILFLSPVARADLWSREGRHFIFPDRHWAPHYRTAAERSGQKPWNLALSTSNELLDARYGAARRRQVNHVPLVIEKQSWQAMLDLFPDAVARTRSARFRAEGNIAVEFLYPYCMLAQGKAEFADARRTRASSGYLPLEDFWPLTAWKLREIRKRRPKWATLNDNFGSVPNRHAERIVRQALEEWFPEPSPFERRQ